MKIEELTRRVQEASEETKEQLFREWLTVPQDKLEALYAEAKALERVTFNLVKNLRKDYERR